MCSIKDLIKLQLTVNKVSGENTRQMLDNGLKHNTVTLNKDVHV